MPIANKIDNANLTQYQETINEFGELVITAKDGNTDLAQTVPLLAPGVLFYDPTNFNFYAVGLTEYDPNWKFVSLISGIS